MLSEYDIEAVLATFCCYDHGAKPSEAVQKTATDKKRVSQMLLVCYDLLNSQNIPITINQSSNSEKWLVTTIHQT